MKIKDLPKLERPREKLERYGLIKLMDHELLATIIGTGIKGINVVSLSKKIIEVIKEIGPEKITVNELAKIKGLGKIKSAKIISAIEIGRRLYYKQPEIILTPEKIFELCSDIRDQKREHFAVFLINSRNFLIKREIISIGTLNEGIANPREIFESALQNGACSIIVVHNHPSGEVSPSDEDRMITDRIKEAGSILGIELKDHIILTGSQYWSFSQKGLI